MTLQDIDAVLNIAKSLVWIVAGVWLLRELMNAPEYSGQIRCDDEGWNTKDRS
jgi:hypothetical protein